MTRKTAIGPSRSRPALQRNRASPSISYAQSVSPVSRNSPISRGDMMLESMASSRSPLMGGRSWRTSSPCRRSSGGSLVRRCRSDAPASTSTRNSSSMAARASASSAALRPGAAAAGTAAAAAAPGPAARTTTAGPPRARRERHRHLPARRPIGKAQRVRAAEPRSRVGIGDLAHQGQDLRVGERVLGERAGGAVGHQRGGLAHHELERVGALLVQHLDQAIEPGHGQSQSRGRASRTRALLTYQLTSSVSMAKKMPAPLR